MEDKNDFSQKIISDCFAAGDLVKRDKEYPANDYVRIFKENRSS